MKKVDGSKRGRSGGGGVGCVSGGCLPSLDSVG